MFTWPTIEVAALRATSLQGHTFVAAHGVQYKSSCGLAPSQRVMIPPESQPGHKLFANKNAHEKLDAAAYYRANPEELVKTCIPTPDRKMGTIETGKLQAMLISFTIGLQMPRTWLLSRNALNRRALNNPEQWPRLENLLQQKVTMPQRKSVLSLELP